jgi:Na+-translocating ferredoxin:NAD+ oxidoreductase subunit G
MKTVIHMIATLTIIGVVTGGILFLVSDWANPLIAANQKNETEKAIFLVHPEGKSYEPVSSKELEAYKVFDANKKLIGYSLVYEGNGFQGKIRMMIGLSEDFNSISSLEILEQVETPGLGNKITEEPFKKQFNGLKSSPKILWVKNEKPDQPNEIQAITGATISSKSVVAIINEGIGKMRELKERGNL